LEVGRQVRVLDPADGNDYEGTVASLDAEGQAAVDLIGYSKQVL
jgi:hypothetical protein